MKSYSWVYPAHVGYPGLDDPYSSTLGIQQTPPYTPPGLPQPSNSQCYQTWMTPYQAGTQSDQDQYPKLCFYLPTYQASTNIQATGYCPSGGGANGSTAEPIGTPQAPCAFACHDRTDNNDYYNLAKNKLNIQLRLDVVHAAASQVVKTLQSYSQIANQFSIGIYEFNSVLQAVYPTTGSGESGTDLGAASTAISNAQPPLTTDQGNTYFQASATALANILTPAGNGASSSTPVKNLFIVTDGLSDMSVNGEQFLGTITSASNEQICQMFKDKGFNVFVLYTTYLPVPTATYLDPSQKNLYAQQYAEPTNGDSPIVQALKACASSPSNYFLASNSSDINTAMQQMLQAALNSAGRISK